MPTFDATAAYARDMLARRAEQDVLFDIPLRGTIAWDVLLALFVADAEGRCRTGRQIAEDLDVSVELGQRWLAYLLQHRLVSRSSTATPDEIVSITPHAISRLEGYVERCLMSGRNRR